MTTADFARLIVETPIDLIPRAAIDEAKRSLLNWLGVAIGASSHPMVDIVLDITRETGSNSDAAVVGRSERVDMISASLINGMSSHIFDYDDTLLDTVLHPSAPVYPAILAYAEKHGTSGSDVLSSFVVGLEAAQRVARVVYPSHYDKGWHITGSVGAFGAAASVGRLIGLSTTRMNHALGIAATQPVGLREMFGTYTKPFHPGKAAANGLMSAMLAQRGFTSSLRSIEAPRGFAHVTSESPVFARLTGGWGEAWEIMNNSYKPFPCGVVIHPAIDGVLRLRELGVIPSDVLRIEMLVHPLVLELTGKKTPRDGLEAKFSVYHCVASGLIDGWVGLAQFEDSRVAAPDVLDLRARVNATADTSLAEDQVRIKAVLKSGEVIEVFVEHCLGSKHNPMTTEQLLKKFCDVTRSVMPAHRQQQVIDEVFALDKSASVRRLMKLVSLGR